VFNDLKLTGSNGKLGINGSSEENGKEKVLLLRLSEC
jgi:hypothetical protein